MKLRFVFFVVIKTYSLFVYSASCVSDVCLMHSVTQDGKVYACGEATNGRLGLGLSSGSVSVPRQLSSLSQYVVRKVAVHSGMHTWLGDSIVPVS